MAKAVEIKQLRSFGLLVGSIFSLIGLLPLLSHSEGFRLWALLLAAALMIPAIISPRSLAPAYRVWMAIGYALGWINTRIILGIIFYGLFVPVGLARRLLGKDLIAHGFSPEDTYRSLRSPRPPSHMKRQF